MKAKSGGTLNKRRDFDRTVDNTITNNTGEISPEFVAADALNSFFQSNSHDGLNRQQFTPRVTTSKHGNTMKTEPSIKHGYSNISPTSAKIITIDQSLLNDVGNKNRT